MPRTTVETNERVNLRVPPQLKVRLVRAAALTNRDLTSFVMSSALREADAVIAAAERLSLSARDSVTVLDLLENPPAPNHRLRRAAQDLPPA